MDFLPIDIIKEILTFLFLIDINNFILLNKKNYLLKEQLQFLIFDKEWDFFLKKFNYDKYIASLGIIKNNKIKLFLHIQFKLNKNIINNIFKSMCEKNNIEMVKILLNNKNIKCDYYDNFAIRYTSANGFDILVELLLKESIIDPSAMNNYAIKLACFKGYDKNVQLLLKDKRVDPSVKNNYCIRKACKYGHVNVVKILLNDSRVDPSVKNNYSLNIVNLICKNTDSKIKNYYKIRDILSEYFKKKNDF